MTDNASGKNGTPRKDPKTGKFLPGNPGGPGRPRGSGRYQLPELCRRKAAEAGVDLEGLLWHVVVGLAKAGAEGNIPAAELVFDRLCGPVDKSPLVAVEVDARSVSTGPQPPTGVDLVKYLEQWATVHAETLKTLPEVDTLADEVIDDLLK